jgi:hypothetical protein
MSKELKVVIKPGKQSLKSQMQDQLRKRGMYNEEQIEELSDKAIKLVRNY